MLGKQNLPDQGPLYPQFQYQQSDFHRVASNMRQHPFPFCPVISLSL